MSRASRSIDDTTPMSRKRHFSKLWALLAAVIIAQLGAGAVTSPAIANPHQTPAPQAHQNGPSPARVSQPAAAHRNSSEEQRGTGFAGPQRSGLPENRGAVSGTTRYTGQSPERAGPVGENGWKPPSGSGTAPRDGGARLGPEHPAPVGENGWKPPATGSHDRAPDPVRPVVRADHPVAGLHSGDHHAPVHGRPGDRHGRPEGPTLARHHDDAGRIANPHVYAAWGWNHGTEWVEEPRYWGGAFWGPIALGVSVGTYVAIVPDSPGFVLLSNYSLIQAPCDPAGGQVEIYGPDGTIICALPNSLVPQGRYEIDMSTLTLQVTTDE